MGELGAVAVEDSRHSSGLQRIRQNLHTKTWVRLHALCGYVYGIVTYLHGYS